MVVLKSLATPVVWILVLLTLSLILTWQTRRKRLSTAGRYLLLTGTALLFTLSLNPVANLLTYPLEAGYRPPPLEILKTLDIVVVLGGGLLPSGPLRDQAELSDNAYPRLYHGVQVFRQSGAGLLAFCGGPGREGSESETEAETMKAMALSLGIPEERILTETQSFTTFENSANLNRLLPPGQDRHLGLVTSATHMRRSYRVFCRQFPHDTIVPVPVYYTYRPARTVVGNLVPSLSNLDKSDIALHEWIGLMWYSLRGR